jgi:hypothetical protein
MTSWYEIHVKENEVLDKDKKDSRARWLSVHDFHATDYDPSSLQSAVVTVLPTLQTFLKELDAKDVCRFDIRVCSSTGKVQVMVSWIIQQFHCTHPNIPPLNAIVVMLVIDACLFNAPYFFLLITLLLLLQDVNNVACCNFEFLTAYEKSIYVEFLQALL